jgi:hypothetical protein
VSREQSSLGLPLATEGTQEARLSYAKAKPLFEAKPQRTRKPNAKRKLAFGFAEVQPLFET